MTPTLFHNLCNFRSQRRWWLTEEKQAHFYNYFLEFAATHPKKKKLRWDSRVRKLIIEKRKKNIGSYHTKTISLADQIKTMEKVDGFQNKMNKRKNQVVAVINNGTYDAPTIN